MPASDSDRDEIVDRYCHWSKLLRAAQTAADAELTAFYAQKVKQCETLSDELGVPVRYLAMHRPTDQTI